MATRDRQGQVYRVRRTKKLPRPKLVKIPKINGTQSVIVPGLAIWVFLSLHLHLRLRNRDVQLLVVLSVLCRLLLIHANLMIHLLDATVRIWQRPMRRVRPSRITVTLLDS